MQKDKNQHNIKKFDFLILAVILFIALIFRLYKITNPLADWHSWRQVDTAAVARNFVRDGFDLLHPRFDDFSNAQSNFYNSIGYRFVEFPVYNAIFAAEYKIAPFIPIEIYGRLTTIFFSLILILNIYYLVFKEEGRTAAFFSALIFSVFPFFVYYSRVVLPDMTAISLIFLGITSLLLWSKKSKFSPLFFIFSILTTSFALLVKPTTIFYFIPLLYIFYKKFGSKIFKAKEVYIFFAITTIPLILWRTWIRSFPEGIPISTWLITSVQTYEGTKNIFFRPAFFRWIFQERILNLITGGYLIIFIILGILKKNTKSLLFVSILLGSAFYLFTFQGGNVQHDYYQIMILPTLAIFSGIGISLILKDRKYFFGPLITIPATLAILTMSFLFSYYNVKNFYDYSVDVLNISKIVKTVTEPDAIIVTDTVGDTTLLYLSDRRGYPLVSEDLGELKKRGAKYFITQKKDVALKVKLAYKLIFESDKVYIFRL